MLKDIYDPLTEYVNVFHDRFKTVAKETFAQLAAEAKVDVEANRATCRQLYEATQSLKSAKRRKKWWKVWCVLLWVGVTGSIITLFVQSGDMSTYVFVLMGVGVILVIAYLLMSVHPQIRILQTEGEDLSETCVTLEKEGWKQMAPLNRLYDWDVLTRMMMQTVPRLEFDPYFSAQRLADLKQTYHWDDSFNEERSVIYAHSGLINGNPFIICRTRKMEMETKTYSGSKTISWTTRERGSDGKYHTEHHSEVLRATVTAPFPAYYEKTQVIYGNTAAPDLIFYRRQNGMAGREDSLSFKWKKHKLRKKARNLTNADFAMMTNEEFEVAFNTSDRNDNQQYALLFTPLAQESMMKLLTDYEYGYGDDFDFAKYRMINSITPNHLQNINLDMDPRHFQHFDYDWARYQFYALNARNFRAIYFSLAPLLCIPMYQQIRPANEIYGQRMPRRCCFWEHEAMANFWGQKRFKHPDCVTNCILKTETTYEGDDHTTLKVYAHGYSATERLTYISKWGGDGNKHRVPVYWDEYEPVTGSGYLYIKEDNDMEIPETTQSERISHVYHVLERTRLKVYRKHIASRM